MGKSRVKRVELKPIKKSNYLYWILAVAAILIIVFLIFYFFKQKTLPGPDDYIVLQYKFTGGTGDSIEDSSGSGFTGTWKGDGIPQYVEGLLGKALTFSKIGDYVTTDDKPSISGGRDLSVVVLFKPSELSYTSQATNIPLVTKYADGSKKDYGFGFAEERKLYFGYEKFDNDWFIDGLIGTTSVSVNDWHLAAFTYKNSTKNVTIYLDGKAEASKILPTATPDTGANLDIGRRKDIGIYNPKFFKGLIDEVRIYRTTLTGGDITSLYAAVFCGNGQIDVNEECDGEDFGDKECSDFDFTSSRGELLCTSLCKIDLSSCENIECGDNIKEGTEQCDGTDLAGQTCLTKGFGSGTLSCNSTCGFNTAQCVPYVAPPTCGNNVKETGEICDGTDLAGHSCEADLDLEGEMICSNCALNDSLCFTCGNNNIEGNEVCDGNDLAGETCSSLGYDSGGLACNDDCSDYVRDDCSRCGDSVANGDEECDGNDLRDETCVSLGFNRGVLDCNASCELDTIDCIAEEENLCGNSIIDEEEECDGTNITDTCASLGFASGSLSCNSNCLLSTISCVPKVNCTDTCASLGFECGTRRVCGNYTNCGNCESGETCNSAGKCVEETPDCTDTCDSEAYECGTHTICGASTDCGSCDKGKCVNGVCEASSKAWIWITIVILVLGIIAVAFFIIRKGNFSGFKKSPPSPPQNPPMFPRNPAPPSNFNPKFEFKPQSDDERGFEQGL